MSFLSPAFAAFLVAALVVFYSSPGRWRRHVLLGFSYGFYLTWGGAHVVILALVTAGVYLAGLSFGRLQTEHARAVLASVTVASLLALLAGFKWAPWLADVTPLSAGAESASSWLMPLGLSYYLFRTISYVLDVYWEVIPVERNFVSIALYVSFFPQMVSGPIQRAGDFSGQLDRLRRPRMSEIEGGLRRILLGLFKKVVVADACAVLVERVHSDPWAFSAPELWVGVYCFAWQLYFDFAGATDIAIGVGHLFGLTGPENFALPFWAGNLQEFWRRWHMSLTSWLSDYLFLPLRMGLRRWGAWGLCIAVFGNMLAIGIWHGPKWTYAAFGSISGMMMICSALTLKRRNTFFQSRPALRQARRILGPLLTFHLVALAFVFFRATSLRMALTYIAHLVPGWRESWVPMWRLSWGTSRSAVAWTCAGIAVVEAIEFARRQPAWAQRFLAAPRWMRWSLYYGSIAIVLRCASAGRSFIYAQF